MKKKLGCKLISCHVKESNKSVLSSHFRAEIYFKIIWESVKMKFSQRLKTPICLAYKKRLNSTFDTKSKGETQELQLYQAVTQRKGAQWHFYGIPNHSHLLDSSGTPQQKRSSEEGFLPQLWLMFSSTGLLPSGLQLKDQDRGADDLGNLLTIGIIHNLGQKWAGWYFTKTCLVLCLKH